MKKGYTEKVSFLSPNEDEDKRCFFDAFEQFNKEKKLVLSKCHIDDYHGDFYYSIIAMPTWSDLRDLSYGEIAEKHPHCFPNLLSELDALENSSD